MVNKMDYPIQTPRQLSAHLRAFRQTRGLSQAALGEVLGVGQTRVARIEGSPTSISVAQLVEVLAALGVQLVLREIDPSPRSSAGSASKGVGARQRTSASDW